MFQHSRNCPIMQDHPAAVCTCTPPIGHTLGPENPDLDSFTREQIRQGEELSEETRSLHAINCPAAPGNRYSLRHCNCRVSEAITK